MPLVPLATNSGPTKSLFAPAGSGGGGPSTIVSSFATASISSLSVSSINGQTPGGSIPTSLNVSTLGVADSLSVGGGLALGKGIVDIGNLPTAQDITMEILGYNSGTAALFGMSITSDTNTNTMTISSVGATPILLNNISTINGAAYPPPGGGVDPAGISTAKIVPSQTGFPVSIKNSTETSFMTIYSGANEYIEIQSVSTIILNAQSTFIIGPASVSSLAVSSINGAAPGGSAPQFSTLFSGSSTINCDGGQTQVLLSFSTLTNHLYQIQPSILIQGNGGQEGTLDDDVILEVPAVITLNTLQGSFISTANAAARDVNIGMGGMFKAAGGGLSLAINGTFSTSALLNSVNLVDFGAV